MDIQSEKTTILLHLGTHKTGSTSLQKTLARHRKILDRSHICYLGIGGPYRHLYSAFCTDPMRFVWNRASGISLEEIKERDQVAMEKLREHLVFNQGKHVIISSEYLPMLSRKELANLRDFFSPYGKIQAVYFYRELHSWLSSDSQQMAKAGLTDCPTPFWVGLRRIYDFPLKVAEVFGRENTTFLKFEDAVKIGICDCFLSACNLPSLTMLGGKESIENKSVSSAAVEALYSYNARFPQGSKDRNQDEVESLKKLPGGKYQTAGFTPDELDQYAQAREEVQDKLGLDLATPESLPIVPTLEENILKIQVKRALALALRGQRLMLRRR